MEIKYCCDNDACNCPDKLGYEVILQSEAIMDEKNVATLFCPHCNQQLKIVNPSQAVSSVS